MSNRLVKGAEARERIYHGVFQAYEAVRSTLGAKGKTTVFERGTPIFSLDGATILKQLSFRDQLHNMGLQLVRNDAASKTEKDAGDGTTTATILAQSIACEGIKALHAGIDGVKLREGMTAAAELAVQYIKDTARPVKNKKDISDIATVSSRDREVGNLVAGLIEELGKEAIISVEEGQSIGLESEVVKGMELDRGFIAPHFITDFERGEAVMEDAHILLTTQTVLANQDILPILNEVHRNGKNLCVIAHEAKGEALATLVINKVQGRLHTLAIRTPGLGNIKDEILEDIAALTGATVISETTGRRLEEATFADLGKASRVLATEGTAVIVGGGGTKKAINDRILMIKSKLEREKSGYEKEQLQKRIARLSGGVAVIRVGTISETENKEKRYRIEDAVLAAKAACEEGIISGGGMALYLAAKTIREDAEKVADLAVRTGYAILADAIEAPAKQVLANAGLNPDERLATLPPGKGINVVTGKAEDLVKSGIIDPAKVSRCALQNALSVALMLLTTGSVIEEIRDDKDKTTE